MSVATVEPGPSTPEVELLLASLRQGGPADRAREAVRRTTDRTLYGLSAVAFAVGAYDVLLLTG